MTYGDRKRESNRGGEESPGRSQGDKVQKGENQEDGELGAEGEALGDRAAAPHRQREARVMRG